MCYQMICVDTVQYNETPQVINCGTSFLTYDSNLLGVLVKLIPDSRAVHTRVACYSGWQ